MNPAISFIRGIACLAVIFNHQIMNYIGAHGYQIGSPLFILASGYCIKNKDVFIWGRIKKLYPHYFLFLTFMCVINHDLTQYFKHLLFIQNIWVEGSNQTQWLWTIAVIVQLYCLYPLVRKVPVKILLPCAALVEIGYRIYLQVNQLPIEYLAFPFAYVFSWALGISLASSKEPSWGLNLAVAGLLSVICVQVGAWSLQYTLAAIAGYFALYKIIRLPNRFFNNFISDVGKVCYPIYLWHMPVIYMVYVATKGSLLSIPIGLGAAVLIGMIMSKLVSPSKQAPVLLECRA